MSERSPLPERLRIQLLGGFAVWVNEAAVPAAAWRPKAAALVKVLALHPRQRLHREELFELLWPSLSSAAALNNLHRTLHSARRSLGRSGSLPFLAFEGPSLRLCCCRRAEVDLERFLERAAAALETRQLETYQQALALYGGELLPEDCYQDWAARPRELAHEHYIELATELAELYLERRRYAEALPVLRRLVQREPALEAAQLSLMRLYLQLEQPQSAMRQYERLRRALKHEYGFTPCETATQLYLRLLEETRHE